MGSSIDIGSGRPFGVLPKGIATPILAPVRLRSIIARTLLVTGCLSVPARLLPADWPEWRGAGRRGVWNETGVLDRFSSQGLAVMWRAPLGSGYAGPSVSAGRVFVTDFRPGEGLQGR